MPPKVDLRLKHGVQVVLLKLQGLVVSGFRRKGRVGGRTSSKSLLPLQPRLEEGLTISTATPLFQTAWLINNRSQVITKYAF